MTTILKYRAVWITIVAWCLAVTINQLMRGYPIIPPGMTATGYWAIHIIIGSFIGLIIWFVASVAKIMAGSQK